MNADEGFVFALNGSWGSGKTTTINFVLKFLRDKDKRSGELVVVRFNPWWFSGGEQLLQQFFAQFRGALGEPNTPAQLRDLGEKLDRFARLLGPLTLVPAIGGKTGGLKRLLSSVATVTKSAAEALAHDVHKARAAIDEALRNQRARIVVVIDDIDRLPADQIRQVFQVIKAVADFPRTIYLLAFDRVQVIRALEKVQAGGGEMYLEKIVQAPFDLPPIDRISLRGLLTEHLNEVLGEIPPHLWDDVQWGNLFVDGIDPLVRTPRDVKRFVNILRPTYPLVLGEVNVCDFLGLQALRIFAPDAHTFVASHKDLVAGTEDSAFDSDQLRQERRKLVEAVMESVSPEKRGPVKHLLTTLFPRLASFYGGPSYGSSVLSDWRKKRRVCSPDVFDLYFVLSIPAGDISAAEMGTILSLGEDSQAFGRELVRLRNEKRPDGVPRLRAFLEQMEDYTGQDIPTNQIGSILRAIFDVGDQLFSPLERSGMLDFGDELRLVRVSYQLLQRLGSQQDRFELLRNVFSEAKAVSLMTHFASLLDDEHGRFGRKQPDEPEERRSVAANHIPELEAIVLQKIRMSAAESRLREAPSFGYVLHRWSEWGEENEVKRYVSTLIGEDEGLADFLVGFLQVTFSEGWGDRVARQIWRVHLPSVQRFTGIDPITLLVRCEKILSDSPEWLTDRRRQALETFHEEIRNPRDEWGRKRRPGQGQPAPISRGPLRADERKGVLEALSTPNSVVAIEALKDLERDLYSKSVEQDSELMGALFQIAEKDRGEAGQRTLRVLRTLMVAVPGTEKASWARRIRDICLKMCLEPPPSPVAQEALGILAAHPREEDIKMLEQCIENWPRELYETAKPLGWLKAVSEAGYRSAVTEMLRSVLRRHPDDEITRRVTEAMDLLRSS